MSIEQSVQSNFVSNNDSLFDQLIKAKNGLLDVSNVLSDFLLQKSVLLVASSTTSNSLDVIAVKIANELAKENSAIAGNLILQFLKKQNLNASDAFINNSEIINVEQTLQSKNQETLNYINTTENAAFNSSFLLANIIALISNHQKQTKKVDYESLFTSISNSITGKNGIIDNYIQSNLSSANKANTQLQLQTTL